MHVRWIPATLAIHWLRHELGFRYWKLDRRDIDDVDVKGVLFSDEPTFLLSICVNKSMSEFMDHRIQIISPRDIDKVETKQLDVKQQRDGQIT